MRARPAWSSLAGIHQPRLSSRAVGGRAEQRNGYNGDLTVKTIAGPVGLKRPKLRDTTEAFASQLL